MPDVFRVLTWFLPDNFNSLLSDPAPVYKVLICLLAHPMSLAFVRENSTVLYIFYYYTDDS